jgi:hypothetical protein
MIHVTRSQIPVPSILTGQKSKKEQTDARIHYRKAANRSKEFKFKVYQDPSVREGLEKLFRMKCAYCETKIGAGDESEIEHWRPKGAVKEIDGRRSFPAYYWLASTWENLLLSCLKCNRPRKYRIPGGEEDDPVWERSGKGMIFPLTEGDVRATKQGGEDSEHPLLLNPCKDKPGTYLDFVVLDEVDPTRKALLRPKTAAGTRFERAASSIDIYSLNRPPLLERRQLALTTLQRDLADFKVAFETFKALPPGEPRDNQAQLMKSRAEAIKERLKPEAEYRLMTDQALKHFLDRNPAVRKALELALGI